MRCRSLGILACTVVAPLLAIFCSSSVEVGKQAACNALAGASPQAKVPPPKPTTLPAGLEAAPQGDLLGGNRLTATTQGPATPYEAETSSASQRADRRPDNRPPAQVSSIAAAMDRLSGPRSPSVNPSAAPSRVIPGRLVPVSGIEEIAQTQPTRSPTLPHQNGGQREETASSLEGDRWGNPGPPSAPVDRFASIQQRLRQLGATYYRLETWGDRGEEFRFQCRIGSGQDARSVRHFEAMDLDAVRAMVRVLGQVESLQASAGQN